MAVTSPQDNSPTSEPSGGLTTPPNALPYWLPVAQGFWRDQSMRYHTFSLVDIAHIFTTVYAVPLPAMNYHPEDPPPAQSRGDQCEFSNPSS